MSNKAELDRRELLWFRLHRGWMAPDGTDTDQWLGDMRERDEMFCYAGNSPTRCPRCGPSGPDYCKGCL